MAAGLARALLVPALAVALVAAGGGTSAAQSNRDVGSRALGKAAKQLQRDVQRAKPRSRRQRRALKRSARRIRRSVKRKRYCRARRQLRSLGRAAKRRRRGRRLSRRHAARINRDILDLDSLLLVQRGTRRCGGAKDPPAPALTTRLVSSTPQGARVEVRLPAAEMSLREGGKGLRTAGAQASRVARRKGFVELEMPGLETGASPGDPAVPGTGQLLAVPPGARIELAVVDSSSYKLRGVELFPAQRVPADREPPGTPRAFRDKPFVIDRGAYRSRRPFPRVPAAVGHVGQLRDLRVADIFMAGARYKPRAKELEVYTSVTVDIKFQGGSGKFGTSRTTSVWNRSYERLYESSILNYPTARDNLVTDPVNFCGEELLIVTPPGLRPAAERLATSRRAAGFVTNVFETGAGPAQAGTTNDQIRAFIRSRVEGTSCLFRPSYVILFGNTAAVPTFYKSVSDWGSIATDYRYSLGEPVQITITYPTVSAGGTVGSETQTYTIPDLIPEFAIGRIPARDLADANTMVDKIIGYETAPPNSPDFYRRAAVTAYFQSTGTIDNRGFTKTAERARNVLLSRNKQVDRVYVAPSQSHPLQYYDGSAIPAELRKPGFPWNGTGDNLIGHWNDGRFLIMHRDHGNENGIYDPDVTNNDLGKFANGAELPVFFSINCSSARFDDPNDPSFVERLLSLPNGGVVGAIGDSRDSPTWPNNHMALGLFDAIYPDTDGFGGNQSIKRMGDVLIHAKLYVAAKAPDSPAIYENPVGYFEDQYGPNPGYNAEKWLYHWFGDPSMPIYTRDPFALNPALIQAQVVGAAVQVQVPNPAAGAQVTLAENGTPIGRSFAGPDGSATIRPDKQFGPSSRLTVHVEGDDLTPASKVARAESAP
jgi:hypothetical protein